MDASNCRPSIFGMLMSRQDEIDPVLRHHRQSVLPIAGLVNRPDRHAGLAQHPLSKSCGSQRNHLQPKCRIPFDSLHSYSSDAEWDFR